METTVKLKNDQEAKTLFGRHDQNLRLIEKELNVKITARAGTITITGAGPDINKASTLMEELLIIIRKGGIVRAHDISCAAGAIKEDASVDIPGLYLERIDVLSKRLYVTPKTKGQKEYIEAIKDYDLVFALGPAGTGKT